MVRSEQDGSGASGAIEPLADVGRLLPSGVTNVAGGGPSHGAEHPDLDAHLAELARQSHHLGLHAAWHRQAVGADHRHPQQLADRLRPVSPDFQIRPRPRTLPEVRSWP